MHSKLTYTIWYVTSNLRELVQNSKVICQKTSNALMKTGYCLFLLIKRYTYISFLRTVITNYWQKTYTAAIDNINKKVKCIAERLHLDD